VDWERHFDFFDDWNFDLLVDWILLDVMMVNGMNAIWDGDLNSLHALDAIAKKTKGKSCR
jgi:hypothetical protein